MDPNYQEFLANALKNLEIHDKDVYQGLWNFLYDRGIYLRYCYGALSIVLEAEPNISPDTKHILLESQARIKTLLEEMFGALTPDDISGTEKLVNEG